MKGTSCVRRLGRMYARGSAGVPGSPPLLRGRRGTMCTVKGSDVRPGVPLASLGLRLFCVAGVGQCALSRGRMYAPGFRWHPWVSASFAWQAWDGARNLAFFRAKWLQPAMKGTSCVRRLRLRSFGFFYVFCSNGCSCVHSSMRFLKLWLQMALEWLHECCMLCVVGRKPEHETLCFSV